MKKLFIITCCLFASTLFYAQSFFDDMPTREEHVSDGYVDLGLPSGTRWQRETPVQRTSGNINPETLPLDWQVKELIDVCTWEWNGEGYTVTGLNGNSITIPAQGHGPAMVYIEDLGIWVEDAPGGDKGVRGFYWYRDPNPQVRPNIRLWTFGEKYRWPDCGQFEYYKSANSVLLAKTGNKDAYLAYKEKAKEEAKNQLEKEKETLRSYGKYVDLGLPSGTKWNSKNVPGYFNGIEKEKYKYGLPNKAQLDELIKYCRIEKSGNGYRLIGPNGNSIEITHPICRSAKDGDSVFNAIITCWLLNADGYPKQAFILTGASNTKSGCEAGASQKSIYMYEKATVLMIYPK